MVFKTLVLGLCSYPLTFPLFSSTVLYNHVRFKLQNVIAPSQLQDISNSCTTIDKLTSEQQVAVRMTFAEGYNKQMRIMAIFGGAAVLTTVLKTPHL